MDARVRVDGERLSELAQAVVREPRSIPYRLDLAMALLEVGRRPEAIQLFRDIALSYAEDGQLIQAMAVCRGILDIDPSHDETIDLLATFVERRRARTGPRLIDESGPPPAAEDDPSAAQDLDAREEDTGTDGAAGRWDGAPRIATPIDGPTVESESAPTHDDGADDSLATPRELHALPAPGERVERPDSLAGAGFAADDDEPDEPTSPGVQVGLDAGAEPPDEDVADPVASALLSSSENTPDTPTDLPTFPLFSDLPTAAFSALLRELNVVERGPGELLLAEGSPGDAFYLIADGSVRVKKGEVEVALLGPGAFFGEFAVLADQRRHATVESVTAVELLEVTKTLLDRLVAEHPGVARTLRAFYADRLLATMMATAPIFSALSIEERAEVATRFRARRFGRGATIVEQGTSAGGLYLILVGEVEVVRSDAAGAVDLGRLGEGSYFGEMSLLKGSNASATVRAVRMCETVQLPPRDFYEVVSRHPVLWEELRVEAQRRELTNVAILAGEARGDDDAHVYLL